MKNSLLTLLTAFLIITAVIGCGKKQENDTTINNTKVTNVEIYMAKETTFEEYLRLPVVVKPNRQVNLGLTSGGKITMIHVDKGDRVTKDMVLLETDDWHLKIASEVAQASYEFQKKEFSRNEKLFRDGSVSETVYDSSKLMLAEARGTYEMARKRYKDATLKAPFAGVVTSRNVEVGDILAPGAPALRIIDMSKVKVQAGIPEKYIADFKVGNNVEITFDAIPNKTFRGKINYIAPEASVSVRTFIAEIIVVNKDGDLMAGIMGDASILRNVHEGALMIPLNALIDTQKGRILFIARDDNTAEERSIDIGSNSDTEVMITAGIEPGEKVIAKGQHDLVEGERIKIMGEVMSGSTEGLSQ
ncbi:efflux RND transporter periplasmic adaptor subunit [Candidatus Omnitrophota bacterium]